MAAQQLAEPVGVAPTCRALGLPRATFYRLQRVTPGHPQPRPTPARALCEAEREQVLDGLTEERFVDRSPGEEVATRRDEGRYWCSERTMYRILAANQAVVSGAITVNLPTTASCNCSPTHPISSGVGISPSCEGRRNGLTTTSMDCLTSLAARPWVGGSLSGRIWHWLHA